MASTSSTSSLSPTISSVGVGSNLNASAIISALMAVEQKPLDNLQSQQSDLKTQLSTYGQMQSYVSAMNDKASALSSLSLWKKNTAVSSDATSVAVTTTGGAAAGSYAVGVQKLAAMQTVSSRAFASSSSTLNEGSLTIELGSWTGDATNPFAAKSGSSPLSITIGPGDTSLAAIRDKINAAGAGVTATIVNDASGARLALRSGDTGAENAFRITANESTDDGDATTGLSALAYSAEGGASQMLRTETAANAQATINGIAVSSASNTLSGVADGLTITLAKVTPTGGDTNLTVTTDTASVKTAITDFVKAFNDLAGFIKTQTKYDEASKTGGTLQGDRTTINLQWQLRGVLNQSTSASSVFGRLSDVGIAMNADGNLQVDSSKLDKGLANLPELQKLLATDGPDTASSGFIQRFKDLATQALASDGPLTTRNTGLNASIKLNQKQQDAMQTRLDATEKRITAQYQALDVTMAKLNQLSSYVTQQMSMLNARA